MISLDLALGVILGLVASFSFWIYWEMREGRRVYDAAKAFFNAGENINRVYVNQVEVVRKVCTNTRGEVLQGEKLQDLVIYHLALMKDELESDLGVGDKSVRA